MQNYRPKRIRKVQKDAEQAGFSRLKRAAKAYLDLYETLSDPDCDIAKVREAKKKYYKLAEESRTKAEETTEE